MILSGWEAVFFWVFSIAAIFAGLLTVMARNTIHSALFLISALVSVAALFILLRAEFVAGVQILVYVGGVMVLFLFVVMLVQTRAEEESKVKLYTGQMWAAVVLALVLSISFFFAMNPAQPNFRPPAGAQAAEAGSKDEAGERSQAGAGQAVSSDTESVGEALYKQAALPFEIASVLLLVAMVGAVLLARGTR